MQDCHRLYPLGFFCTNRERWPWGRRTIYLPQGSALHPDNFAANITLRSTCNCSSLSWERMSPGLQLAFNTEGVYTAGWTTHISLETKPAMRNGRGKAIPALPGDNQLQHHTSAYETKAVPGTEAQNLWCESCIESFNYWSGGRTYTLPHGQQGYVKLMASPGCILSHRGMLNQ